ncbi:MAG: acyl-CoA thioesterase [Planctomycetota bacterium]
MTESAESPQRDSARTDPAIRVVMMPRDTNPQGTIFGGVILSLIDQAAFNEACHTAAERFVTVAMNGVEFHQPVHVGDIVSLYSETTRIGRTSITVHVEVFARSREKWSEIKVTEADVTMVAVGEDGRPTPIKPR